MANGDECCGGKMGLAETIRYRAAIYAAVYSPPEAIPRAQAAEVYARLAAAVFPELSLEYVPAAGEKPFKLLMREKQGRRADTVIVDMPSQQGLRLLLDQTWPESFVVAKEKADMTFQLCDPFVSERQVDLVEARIRAQVSTGEKSAMDYLVRKLVGQKSKLASLGTVEHLGLHCEIALDLPATTPLSAPKREVKIERLREEPSSLYIEVMSNWGRVALPPNQGKAKEPRLMPGPLSNGQEKPSAYLAEVGAYIEEQVCSFLEGL